MNESINRRTNATALANAFGADTGHDETHATHPTPKIKRLNINLPEGVFTELETIARVSGRTMTEVVRAALGLIAVAINEEREGHKIIVADKTGKPIKEIVLAK